MVRTLLGAAVRKRRMELGLRQEEVAVKANVSISTVVRVERGHETTIGTLRAIARALDTTIAALMGEAA